MVADHRPKTIFQLDSPFTDIQWPETSPQNQDIILELLCSLLSPIGQHRTNHVPVSKGKRSKKRKRKEKNLKEGGTGREEGWKHGEDIAIQTPPPPEIASFVVTGLNSITRSLENLSQYSNPLSTSKDCENPVGGTKIPNPPETKNISNVPNLKADQKQAFSAIFVSKLSRPPILHSHLPQLVATASLANPSLPATRLIQLPNGSDGRLCEVLGFSRVSFVGILEGAPHSKPLLDKIKDCVPEVKIAWLEEVKRASYLPLKINAIETFAPVAKKAQQTA